jgi:hypothetical protein
VIEGQALGGALVCVITEMVSILDGITGEASAMVTARALYDFV